MEPYQKIELYQRRNFSAKMSATFDFLRQNAARYFKAQLIISGPVALVTAIITGFFMSNIFSGITTSNPSSVFSSGFFGGMVGNVIVSFFMLLVVMLVHYSYLREYREKPVKSITTQNILERVISKLIPGAVCVFLVYILSIVGFFLFVIPGIYIGVASSLVLPILMMEDVQPVDAIRRAFSLITSKWWSTFGLLFVTMILGSLVAGVIQLPAMLVGFLVSIFNSDYTTAERLFDTPVFSGWGMAVMQFFSYLGSIAQYSIILCAIGFQYTNLIEMKESKGLLNAIDQMDEGETSGA